MIFIDFPGGEFFQNRFFCSDEKVETRTLVKIVEKNFSKKSVWPGPEQERADFSKSRILEHVKMLPFEGISSRTRI